MADININPINVGGLAGLSSRGTPDLHLLPYGLGSAQYGQNLLQGAQIAGDLQTAQNSLAAQRANTIYQQQQETARNAATIAGTYNVAQSNQANRMNIANMQNTTQLKQLQQQSLYQNAQTGINQGLLANSQQQTAQSGQYQAAEIANKQQQLQLESTKMLIPMQLAKLGSSNAMLLMGLNEYANDPEKLAAFMQHQNELDVKEGIISPDEATARLHSSPQELQQNAMRNVIMSGIASGGKGSNTGVGGMLPPMMNMYGNMTMSKTAQDQTQTGLIGGQRALLDVGRTMGNFNPDLFPWTGEAQQFIGSKLGNAPEFVQKAVDAVSQATGWTPTTKQMTDLHAAGDAFRGNVLQSIADTLNQQKGVRFNKMTVEVIEPEIPEIGKDTAKSAFTKLVVLQQRMQDAVNFEGQLIQQGLTPNSDKFNKQLADHWSKIPASGKLPVQDAKGNIQEMGYDEIVAAAKQYYPDLPISQSFGKIYQKIMVNQPTQAFNQTMGQQ